MNLILTIEDDDMKLFKKEYLNLGELHDVIMKALSEDERDVEKTNYLIDMYNSRSHFKKFERI